MPETIDRDSPPYHWHSYAMRHRDTRSLPVGKLPPQMLQRLLAAAPVDDPRVLLGPGVGLDCAVIDLGGQLLVCKSDPVTFAIDPLTAIASGALLLAAPTPDAEPIRAALEQKGIPCTEIGEVTDGPPRVLQRTRSGWEPYPLPERDGLARVFESEQNALE